MNLIRRHSTIFRTLIVSAVAGLFAVGVAATTASAQNSGQSGQSSESTDSGHLKVGYVDLHRALNSVDEGKEAKKKLRKDFRKNQKKLNEKRKEVQKLRKELKNQSMMLSDEAKRKKSMELQQRMMDLQKTYMSKQRKLSKKEAKATKKIFDKMRKIVENIAEEKGFDLVLEKKKSSVLYANKPMDLTDELIKRYEKKYGKKK